MNPSNIGHKLHDAESEIRDPGNAKTIVVNESLAIVNLVSTAAETRTLDRPTRQGVEVTLYMMTDGGDIVVTVTGGFNENGDTTLTFTEVGQHVALKSFVTNAGVYFWRQETNHTLGNVRMNDGPLVTGAGAGITSGTGTIYKSGVQKIGNYILTTIYIDLTGLASSTTDLDIIGVGASAAHIGRITAAQNGAIEAIRMTCLELPAGGADDIDLYAATEGTGVFDSAVTDLTETALITSGGAWTNGAVKGSTAVPAANQYLYLTGGEGGTAATYTAGKYLIEIIGY